jgi:hypothetical protein
MTMSKRSAAAVIVDPSSPKKKAKVVDKLSISIPQIVAMFNKAHQPVGWVFEGFYDGREYLKKLSNKTGRVTPVIGEIEFKAFSDLKTKWLPESMLGDHLWGILIEAHDGLDEEASLTWFPSEQEGVPMAWAKKIGRGMILAEVYKNVEVKEHVLMKNEECDFIARFATVTYNEAVTAISLEAIAPGLLLTSGSSLAID